MRASRLAFEFVEYVPKELAEEKLYISIPFTTVVHLCCCGCGRDVVTPLAPNGWTLMFDGETVSLDPSIGNWNFPCQAHYWISKNRVTWAASWSREMIDGNRALERLRRNRPVDDQGSADVLEAGRSNRQVSYHTVWHKLRNLLRLRDTRRG